MIIHLVLSKKNFPLSNFNKPQIILIKVVLPTPDLPVIAVILFLQFVKNSS